MFIFVYHACIFWHVLKSTLMVNIVKFNLLRLKVVSNLPLILFICLFFKYIVFWTNHRIFFLQPNLITLADTKILQSGDEENKIPASITLAQGCLESGAGKSNLP